MKLSFMSITVQSILSLCFSALFHLAVSVPRNTYIVSVETPEALPDSLTTPLEEYYKTFLPENLVPEVDGSAESPLVYAYTEVFSGFSARLTPEELEEVSKKPGFLHAFPNYKVPLHTTRTPEFLGMQLGRGLWRQGNNLGEGVVIGMLDTGITPTHPSFSDAGMQPPPARWKGSCNPPTLCNNKIIGAKTFKDAAGTPVDDEGHGTHTSSTAAGAFVGGANVLHQAYGTAAGMAPRAHLAMYKVCTAEGCTASDLLAGFDEAVKDGVDIISLSLGGESQGFDSDPIAIGSFGAMAKGVLVSSSGGNDGPYSSSVNNVAPWLLTAAASSLDRSFRVTATLPDGRVFYGQGLNQPSNFSSKAFDLVDVDDCFGQMEDVKGKVVLVSGDWSFARECVDILKPNGAVAVIAYDEDDLKGNTILVQGILPLPTCWVNYTAGSQILDYVNSITNGGGTATVSLSFDGTVLGDSPAPVVSYFSSRGPSTLSPMVIKPDITAPGTNILAAWPNYAYSNTEQAHSSSYYFNILSGTSMAAPHISGTAALLKRAHPDWSPAAIKSAIMTSASVIDNTHRPIKTHEIRRAGVLDMGAGQIDPAAAADPGLVYDVGVNDYVAFLCGLGYNGTQISVVTGGSAVTCASSDEISQSGLNYPSIAVQLPSNGAAGSSVSVTRTVTNVGPAPATYEVKVDDIRGVQISVTPSTLAFAKVGDTNTFTVTFVRSGKKSYRASYAEGNLRWVFGKRVVRSPLLVDFSSNA